MPRPTVPFPVAAVEFNPELFEFDANVERACAVIREAAEHGAKLVVLPEAALSGYIYRDLAQFLPYMDEVPGRGTAAIEPITSEHGCYVAIGIAEVDRATGLTYNTGALIGPGGYIGKYRKNGLNPSDILWFTPGNTGYPVFDTELGSIAMVICYDDTYWEPGRLPAIKGADLIAYICSSDRLLPQLGAESAGNHSTIAAVQHLSAWNGLAMVAADRNNAETNPTTGITVTYGGAASIWQADGRRVAHAPATRANLTMTNAGTVLYAQIDPALYDNEQRATLARRRPELYRDLAFWRGPTDGSASKQAHAVRLLALQYRVEPGAFDANLDRASALVEQAEAQSMNLGTRSLNLEPHSQGSESRSPTSGSRSQGSESRSLSLSKGGPAGLLVLPAFSFSGWPGSAEEAAACAEHGLGRTVQAASDFAVRLGWHVACSHVEREGDRLFHAAVLIAPNGTVAGRYRQTHLDPSLTWATAGDDLPVIDTAIGRVGMLLGEDVRFPEAAGVLAVRRADLIAVPTRWDGSYGGPLHDAGGLFANQYPDNTMCLWYAVAKTTQAYTVVANPVDDGCQGSSGIFPINPVDSQEPPVVGSVDQCELVSMSVDTLGSPDWWMNQHRLVNGRRADLAVPAMLPTDSEAFRRWRDAPGWDSSGWTAYAQP